MWGPGAFTGLVVEEYSDAPGGMRTVQYFDKSRMEITYPDADAPNLWYVTNGLLAQELMTGRLQIGDSEYEIRSPSEANAAGDHDDPHTPTYAALNNVAHLPPYDDGQIIDFTIDHNGVTGRDTSLAQYDVRATIYVPETNHRIAEPFWKFMTSSGDVWSDGHAIRDNLFPNPFYAVGFPLTEAYWTHTTVAGKPAVVLIQAFERRVLTYTPSNPAGWQVEAGNVGRHYYEWRYGDSHGQNSVVATIKTGPDTIEYFAKGNPLPGQEDWGPSALSVAPDGTYWLTDSVGQRVIQFGNDGKKLGAIDLADQYAQSILDVDARTGTIWISWANLNFGIYKVQGYTPDGALIVDYDLPEAIWQDPGYLPHGIATVDDGAVIMELMLASRFVRVIDAAGNHDQTPVDGWTYFGRTYRPQSVPGELTRSSLLVDETEVRFEADEGAFALQVNLIPAPLPESFFATRYSVFGDGTFHWDVEHWSTDGHRIGSTTVPMDHRYVYVAHPFSVGPDGRVYMLMAYQDRIEILRLGFQ
jgi:hypothetical protein